MQLGISRSATVFLSQIISLALDEGGYWLRLYIDLSTLPLHPLTTTSKFAQLGLCITDSSPCVQAASNNHFLIFHNPSAGSLTRSIRYSPPNTRAVWLPFPSRWAILCEHITSEISGVGSILNVHADIDNHMQGFHGSDVIEDFRAERSEAVDGFFLRCRCAVPGGRLLRRMRS